MEPTKVEQIIRTSSSWINSVGGLSRQVKYRWNKVLISVFSDHISKSSIQQNILQNKVESDTEKDFALSSIALLQFLVKESTKANHASDAAAIAELVQLKSEEFGFSEKEIEAACDEYAEISSEFENRKKIFIPTTIVPLAFDHLARWLLVWFGPNPNDGEVGPYFWLLNILVLPMVILFYSYWRNGRADKHNMNVLKSLGGKAKYQMVPRRSSLQFTILFLFIIIGTSVTISISGGGSPFIIFSLAAYLIYYLLYFQYFSKVKITDIELAEQIRNLPEEPESLSPDENDEIIVRQVSVLRSVTSRLEAYVLESALFGALAFSAFIQIMAENLVTFESLAEFALHMSQLFQSFVYLDSDLFLESAGLLSNKADLFALISVETLICSMLFLVVIASRLKYSDILDYIGNNLEMARAYNEKEEHLIAKGIHDQEDQLRLKTYNSKIMESLKLGIKGFTEMGPVTSFMRFFRNAGILSFIIVLVSSAFFISSFLSWIFVILGMAALVYFNRDEIADKAGSIVHELRFVSNKYGILIFFLSLSVFIGGFILRIYFNWQNTDGIILLGSIMLSSFSFIWIYILPHYDKTFFSESEDSIERTDKWTVIRLIWAVSMMLVVLGYTFKFIDFGGANELLGFGYLGLIAVFLFIGPVLSKPRWIGIVTSLSISLLVVGSYFKLMHWPLSGYIGLAALLLSTVILIILIYFNRPRWLSSLVNIFLIAAVQGIIFKTLHLPGGNQLISIGLFLGGAGILIAFIFKLKWKVYHHLYLINVLVIFVLSISMIGPGQYIETAYDHEVSTSEDLERITDLRAYTYRISFRSSEEETEDLVDEFLNHLDGLQWYSNIVNENSRLDVDYRNTIMNLCLLTAENLQEKDTELASEWGYHYAHMANIFAKPIGDLYMEITQNPDGKGLPDHDVLYEVHFLKKLGREDEIPATIVRIRKDFGHYPALEKEIRELGYE